MMRILAIETSHDDTALAVCDDLKIVYEHSTSQLGLYQTYGGIIPELSARIHAERLGQALVKLKEEIDLSTVNHIAYTSEPGLIGSLQMGYLFAEALSIALDKPIHPINHMHGHLFAIAFEHQITYPALALIASGGHTQIWQMNTPTDIKVIATTGDDAAGEAFDKIAKWLGFSGFGGPAIEKAATQSDILIPEITLEYDRKMSFSFSGLKTRVHNYLNKVGKDANKTAVANTVQQEIIRQLTVKMRAAINQLQPKSIILGGGVAANTNLRTVFSTLHENALIPSKKLATDNAAMIAAACYEMILKAKP